MSTARHIPHEHSRVSDKTDPILAQHSASVMDSTLARMHELAADLAAGTYLIDHKKLNDRADLNKFTIRLNEQLKEGEYYIGLVDHITGYERNEDLDTHIQFGKLQKYRRFFIHRLLPKLKLTGYLYRRFTGDRHKRISKTEALGRMKYAGFEILSTDESKAGLIYLVQKVGQPQFETKPSFGPLIQLRRMVKGGRMTGIYKMRTMYPYAEFIQDYVYEHNKLEKGGKLKDDFRISEEGRFFRKYFIDELPMLINLLKFDIKLIGVRPLSAHYFSLYTNNMQAKRRQHKPGLLPPYYSEKKKPSSIEEVMVSEIRYLFMYERAPIKTDIKYFFKITKNLLGKKLTSS